MPRIRWGIGLPGPFVLTSSGRRRRGSSGVGWALFAVLVLVGLGFAYPVFGIVLGALIVAGVIAVLVRR